MQIKKSSFMRSLFLLHIGVVKRIVAWLNFTAEVLLTIVPSKSEIYILYSIHVYLAYVLNFILKNYMQYIYAATHGVSSSCN